MWKRLFLAGLFVGVDIVGAIIVLVILGPVIGSYFNSVICPMNQMECTSDWSLWDYPLHIVAIMVILVTMLVVNGLIIYEVTMRGNDDDVGLPLEGE